MSEVVVLKGMVDNMDLDAEMVGSDSNGGDGGLMQEIGEECSEKVCLNLILDEAEGSFFGSTSNSFIPPDSVLILCPFALFPWTNLSISRYHYDSCSLFGRDGFNPPSLFIDSLICFLSPSQSFHRSTSSFLPPPPLSRVSPYRTQRR